MSRPHLHIIGAGLAGLSAAVAAAERGTAVTVYEGAGQAGGRCRSYFDKALGRTIDNGNHLVLSGNKAVRRYIARAGVPDALTMAPEAAFPFFDYQTGERWTVRMNDGPVPWWALRPDRRPPRVTTGAMAKAGRILFARPRDTITALVKAEGPALTRFWEPMSFAVMNLPPDEASAQLMKATALLAWRDGRLARPMFAPRGLGPALVDPALAYLDQRGMPVRFKTLLREMETSGDRVTRLQFAGGDPVEVGPADTVILAVPPNRLNALLPGTNAPEDASAILNAHFLLPEDLAAQMKSAPPILATLNTVTQWIFPKGDMVSLTVSAAQDVDGTDDAADRLTARLWEETRAALGFPAGAEYAAARLLTEKRATFRQTPDNVERRPGQVTAFSNLFLAGDVVDTGLPATIEGAVLSGERASGLALGRA